jgi:hypothetical protein
MLPVLQLSLEIAMASRYLNRQLGIVALAVAALISPAIALDLAWNDSVDVKGCDGNWHQVQRVHTMLQCLENGRPLHCSLEQLQERCWEHFGGQQNGGSTQPSRY